VVIATTALFLSAGCGEAAAPDAGTFDAGSDAGVVAELPWLRDDLGRVVILRGTNVSGDSKDPPDFMANDYVTEADYARLADEIGMNAIRFLIFWEAIEPEPGVYDDVYLAEVRLRIEAAAAAGMLVVVDMHQDVFGRGFGSDGAPRWACDEALYASFEMNRPAEWYLGYARPEVQECFDRLYLDPALRARSLRRGRTRRALRGANGSSRTRS
jgi:endoglycosylceramidase